MNRYAAVAAGPVFNIRNVDGVDAACPKLFVLVHVDGERVATDVAVRFASERLPVLVEAERVSLYNVCDKAVVGINDICKGDVRKFRWWNCEVNILVFLRIVLEGYANVVSSRRKRLHAGDCRRVDGEHRVIVCDRDAAVVCGVELT